MRGTLSVAEVIAFAGVLVALLSVASGWIGFMLRSRKDAVSRVHARIDELFKRMSDKFVTREELNGKLEAVHDDVRETRKRIDRFLDRKE